MLSQSFDSTSNIAKSETVRFFRPVVRRNFPIDVVNELKRDFATGLASFPFQDVVVLRHVRRIRIKVPIDVVRKRSARTIPPALCSVLF